MPWTLFDLSESHLLSADMLRQILNYNVFAKPVEEDLCRDLSLWRCTAEVTKQKLAWSVMQRVCTEVLQHQSKVLSLEVLEKVVGHDSPNTLWHFFLAIPATLTA
jgi:hypothetical protein